MSEPEQKVDVDTFLKYTIAMEYAEIAAQTKYNAKSWEMVKARLDRERASLMRKQNLQTAGMLATAVILGVFIYTCPQNSDPNGIPAETIPNIKKADSSYFKSSKSLNSAHCPNHQQSE